MANTLATRKQAQAIRHQMQLIRNDLPYDADDARARLQQLTDWKYHMRKRPWPLLAAAAIAGYLLVPAKQKDSVIVHANSGGEPMENSAPKKGVVGGIVGALMTLAIKQGTSMAASRLSARFFQHSPQFPESKPKRSPNYMYSDQTTS